MVWVGMVRMNVERVVAIEQHINIRASIPESIDYDAVVFQIHHQSTLALITDYASITIKASSSDNDIG